ncbi:MAG: hypothetical protein GC203_21695 [Phenylobacterium sp.]|uniref:hypothetical protein n=1 Tax=Phenylobacterium sp. TaxID=1871053 RepID=UPI0025FCA310|nr:hypothetical protein [Phenylobacterium sp.]MBI1200483.1 hypothetical protein [Phenylobacterium sp.]
MRALALGVVLASAAFPAAILAFAASPAAGQVTQFEIDNLRAQQEAAQRRAIDLSNQLTAAEAQRQADQAVRALELQQRLPPRLPTPSPAAQPEAGPPAAAPSVVQIPDALLADSNAKVRAATTPHR